MGHQWPMIAKWLKRASVCLQKGKGEENLLEKYWKINDILNVPQFIKINVLFFFSNTEQGWLACPSEGYSKLHLSLQTPSWIFDDSQRKKNSVCVSKLGAACNKKSHLKRISISNVISVVRHPNRKAVLFISNSFLYAKSIHFCLTKP